MSTAHVNRRSIRRTITIRNVRRLFVYAPDTGALYWRVTTGCKMHAGDRAGSIGSKGYFELGYKGVTYQAHRVIWLYVYGRWPIGCVDHVNRNKIDNRLSNLREVSNQHNVQNRIIPSRNNKVGMLGVYRDRGAFYSTISVNGERHSLGKYPTAEEAHHVYLVAKRKLHAGFVG